MICTSNITTIDNAPPVGKILVLLNRNKKHINNSNAPVFVLSCENLYTTHDLIGIDLIQLSENNYCQQNTINKTLKDAITYAKKYPQELPILYFDRFELCQKEIQIHILAIVQSRIAGDNTIPDNLKIIIGSNTKKYFKTLKNN